MRRANYRGRMSKRSKGFQKMQNTGTDRFSAEFYQFFWPELRTELLVSFHFAFQSGSILCRSVNGAE